MKYLIMSSPRTGSTMLSMALNATDRAGKVEEYFHASRLAEIGNPENSRETMLAYFRDIVSANSTVNGVFAMKLHYNQFNDVFNARRLGMASGVGFLKSFDRHVLIRRRDKILQAISELIASKTDLWNTWDPKAAGSASMALDEVDIPLLAQIMSRQIAEEYAWRALLKDVGIPYHDICYEDLVASPDTELARVSAYLGIPGMPTLKATHHTVKLTNTASTAAIKKQFLETLGAFETAT